MRPPASLQDTNDKADEEFAIVFAAMGVNMETAHYFKQVSVTVTGRAGPHKWHMCCINKIAASARKCLLNTWSSAYCLQQAMLEQLKALLI